MNSGLWFINCGIVASLVLLLYSKEASGEKCSRCAASRVTTSHQLAGMTLWRHGTYDPSPITKLHNKILGPCQHDWVFHFASIRESHACGFPQFDHPIATLPEKTVTGLDLFEKDRAIARALEAAGNKTNLLRHLTVGAIHSLAYLDPKELRNFEWESWWSKHEKLFQVCTNKEVARKIAHDYAGSPGIVGYAAEEALHNLNQATQQDNAKP